MRRIICIGNRFVNADSGGPMVYDRLRALPPPWGVEIIDGGLAGLGLLRFLVGPERVIFVDMVEGFAPKGEIAVLSAEEVAECSEAGFDHSAGPAFLLRILPQVHGGRLPEICLVGIEGAPRPDGIERVADICLTLAMHDGPLEDGIAAVLLRTEVGK